MVDWSSPLEIAKDEEVFERLMFALLGIVLWELFTTCDFEWSLLSGKRRFRWPLVLFFFLCRYCILFAIVGLIVSLTVSAPLNCGALYTFNSWAGNMTILCASTSLMLRTIALWERKKSVVIPLGILCVAHWALLYRTMFIVQAVWDDISRSCKVTQTNPSILNVTFFFTMGFDFVILIFTFVALTAKHTARTDLWRLLFADGLVYFIVSFSTNCIPAVLNILNLNTPMNVIATVPAAAISSIASCRAVIRLLEFNSGDVYVHTISAATSSNRAYPPLNLGPSATKFVLTPRPEVHVTTERVTVSEYPPSGAISPFSNHKSSSSSDLESGHKEYNTDNGEYVVTSECTRAL